MLDLELTDPLDAAARRVAARDGARDLSLRGVAAEAGFAPAALYGYFRNKDELLLALATDDLTALARAMRGAGSGLASAGAAALDLLRGAETMAAASAAPLAPSPAISTSTSPPSAAAAVSALLVASLIDALSCSAISNVAIRAPPLP